MKRIALALALVVAPAAVASAWTGKQMILFGRAGKRGAAGSTFNRVNVAAAYDPARNAWRRLSPPGPTGSFMGTDAVLTGKEVLFVGQGTRLAYNPRTNRWRRLPGSPLLSIHDGYGIVVWTGREMIGWGGGCCGDAFSDGVAYNPATNRWRALAPTPLAGGRRPRARARRPPPPPALGGGAGGSGHARGLLVAGGGGGRSAARVGFAYNPATNRWR